MSGSFLSLDVFLSLVPLDVFIFFYFSLVEPAVRYLNPLGIVYY